MVRHFIIETGLKFTVKTIDGNNPEIRSEDYVMTLLNERNQPRKYVFKNRNNIYVNPDELVVIRT